MKIKKAGHIVDCATCGQFILKTELRYKPLDGSHVHLSCGKPLEPEELHTTSQHYELFSWRVPFDIDTYNIFDCGEQELQSATMLEF